MVKVTLLDEIHVVFVTIAQKPVIIANDVVYRIPCTKFFVPLALYGKVVYFLHVHYFNSFRDYIHYQFATANAGVRIFFFPTFSIDERVFDWFKKRVHIDPCTASKP